MLSYVNSASGTAFLDIIRKTAHSTEVPKIKDAVFQLEGSKEDRLKAFAFLKVAAKKKLHEPLISAGLLPLLVSIISQAADKETTELDPYNKKTELYFASAIAAEISWPEIHTADLVKVGIVSPAVRIVHRLEKSPLRIELVRLLFSISESVWLRDSISEAAKTHLPPEDVVVDGKFANRIKDDFIDVSEENYWTELIKNIDLTSAIYFPDKKAFWDVKDFPQLKILEDNWEIIRDEALEAIQHFLVAWPEKNICEKGWNVFPFKAFDSTLKNMCEIAPKTAALLEKVPKVTTALFSTLQPRTHIKPHVGYYQYSEKLLRVHLGLSIPPGCVLRVNGESKGWEEGKLMVFDDTFRHEAWNPSHEKTRIVLMFDILCDVEESYRNPAFVDLSKKRREEFGSDALISSDLINAFSSLGGDTDHMKLRPEDLEFP